MSNYWVVGAMFGGQDDAYESFIRGGYWFCGYSEQQQPAQFELVNRIEIGDRIAIKRMLGQGATQIEIRAIGIVKETEEIQLVDGKQRRIYVNWVIPELHRNVPAKGAFATIHGPFPADEEWTRQVFQL